MKKSFLISTLTSLSVCALAAGAVINNFCQWEGDYLVGDWQTPWFIFAGFALAVAVSFWVLFKYKHNPDAMQKKVDEQQEKVEKILED